MADPGYDFFATGAAPAEPATAPTQNRFGGPVEAAPEAPAPAGPAAPAAPAVPAYAAPAPVLAAPVPAVEPAVPVSVPGYNPGSVNRFGTPTDLEAVPTGPYAAPGLGAAPIESPGLVSTWSGPAADAPPAPAAPVDPVSYAPPAPSTAYAPAPPAAAPAYAAPAAPVAAYPPPAPAYPPPAPAAPAPVAVSRFGSPIPPDVLVEDPSYAALAFGTSGAASGAYGAPAGAHGHHGAAPAAAAGVPGTVKAAGIIGIVEGALSLGLGLLALLGYLALKSQIDQLASSPELAGSGLTAGSLLGLMLVGIVIVLLIGGGFLVAGIATLKGARWGAWALLVVSALGVLYGLYEMVTGDGGFGTLVSIGVSGAVVVLLVVKDSMAWLRSS